MKKRIVFSDLDGTLLDHRTYDFSAALPGLARLRQLGIPLILCSSKTAAEIIPLRRQIGCADPFIVENGGAVYLPAAGFRKARLPALSRRGFQVLGLGKNWREAAAFLSDFCRRRSLSPRLFTDMTAREVAAEAGLSELQASLSLDREYDLPFRLEASDEILDQLRREASRRGFRLVAGGRYLHLTGDSGKGEAAERVCRLYEEEWGTRVRSAGLGDSLNDLDLLRAVDCPVVIPNPASGAPLGDLVRGARVAPEPGPAGWAAAVLETLETCLR